MPSPRSASRPSRALPPAETGPREHHVAEDLDPAHDPGPDVANARLEAEGVDAAATEPLRPRTATWSASGRRPGRTRR